LTWFEIGGCEHKLKIKNVSSTKVERTKKDCIMMNHSPENTPHLISVVVPVHTFYPELGHVRAAIQHATNPIEVLLVAQKNLAKDLGPMLPHEQLITTVTQGRGTVLAEGAKHASGDIIVFLHADTILPEHWDHALLQTMDNPRVIGGGFSLAMDETNAYLKLLIALVTLLFHAFHELWGDRALFVRSSFIKQHLAEFAIPMMEDVHLTQMMKKHGTVVLLKEKVTTSAVTFRTYGLLHNTLRILLVRLWYAVGRDPQKIYEYYYRSPKSLR
jgi:hypothetical protein